jgi:starch phosphorylase
MPKVHGFNVVPRLPERLAPLREIALNLRWTWDHDAIDLFRRIERDAWDATGHNPVRLIADVRTEVLEACAKDESFLVHMDRVAESLREHLAHKGWWQQHYGPDSGRIAYFALEFGIHESLPIYSGGLGILSGDHLKSSSELGLPLIGVGLLYQKGYFRQYLNDDGWQLERYPEVAFHLLPLTLEKRPDGRELRIELELPGRRVQARIWRAQVGRIPLYLLDTNVVENSPGDRAITDELYGGDTELRLRQELLLGIGGVRALAALGLAPTVFHMNEGHAAFLSVERIRATMKQTGASFWEARELCRAGQVFTTHTPVPAGFDFFSPSLLRPYLQPFLDEMRIPLDEFLKLGRASDNRHGDSLSMAHLALRHAAYLNGVSQLHGRVAREMWRNEWSGLPADEVPIGSITNGIHTRSWISGEMTRLFDTYLGRRWRDDPTDHTVWGLVDRIPDAELWRAKERGRERLVAFARKRLVDELRRRGASPREIAQAAEVLDPGALTIGFARRFASYKRADLLLRDRDRLKKLLRDEERPVQFLWAGKAHPRDEIGKALIRQVVHFARQEGVPHRCVFLEDYDIEVARALVAGCDVWLNTPRRPHEASGTSGMKVIPNGGLNLSILDGWWAEAFTPETGWAIGDGEEYAPSESDYQDRVESEALYNLLERRIVPAFYDVSPGGLPRTWLHMMKQSMATLAPVFNTNRMVQEYAERFYQPAAERFARLAANGLERVKPLARWKEEARHAWPAIAVEDVRFADAASNLVVGSGLEVRAMVRLGTLRPEDVEVQIVHGPLGPAREILHGHVVPMRPAGPPVDGRTPYAGEILADTSGHHGFAVRVLPRHPDLDTPYELRRVTWES